MALFYFIPGIVPIQSQELIGSAMNAWAQAVIYRASHYGEMLASHSNPDSLLAISSTSRPPLHVGRMFR